MKCGVFVCLKDRLVLSLPDQAEKHGCSSLHTIQTRKANTILYDNNRGCVLSRFKICLVGNICTQQGPDLCVSTRSLARHKINHPFHPHYQVRVYQLASTTRFLCLAALLPTFHWTLLPGASKDLNVPFTLFSEPFNIQI